MATYNFDIGQVPQIMAAIDDGMKGKVLDGLLSAAYRLQGYIQGEYIPSLPRPPVGIRGAYKAGWKVKPLSDGALLFNDVPYAPMIEQGVRPGATHIGRAMIDAIERWVRFRALGGHSETRTTRAGVTKRTWKKATDSERRSIAWAIAKSIVKRGLWQPRGIRALEAADKLAAQFVREEILKALRGAL